MVIKAKKYIFLQCKHINCSTIDEKHNQRLSWWTWVFVLISLTGLTLAHWHCLTTHCGLPLEQKSFDLQSAAVLHVIINCASTPGTLTNNMPVQFYKCIRIKLFSIVCWERDRERLTWKEESEQNEQCCLWCHLFFGFEISCL